jgi:hypothetical protein
MYKSLYLYKISLPISINNNALSIIDNNIRYSNSNLNIVQLAVSN